MITANKTKDAMVQRVIKKTSVALCQLTVCVFGDLSTCSIPQWSEVAVLIVGYLNVKEFMDLGHWTKMKLTCLESGAPFQCLLNSILCHCFFFSWYKSPDPPASGPAGVHTMLPGGHCSFAKVSTLHLKKTPNKFHRPTCAGMGFF